MAKKLSINSIEKTNTSQYETFNYLTRYEKVRNIGARAKEISDNRGPKIAIDWDKVPLGKKLDTSIALAIEELRQRRSPYSIKRGFNDTNCEIRNVGNLIPEEDLFIGSTHTSTTTTTTSNNNSNNIKTISSTTIPSTFTPIFSTPSTSTTSTSTSSTNPTTTSTYVTNKQ